MDKFFALSAFVSFLQYHIWDAMSICTPGTSILLLAVQYQVVLLCLGQGDGDETVRMV